MMKRLALAASVMLILTPAAALAADAVRTEVVRAGGYVRINFVWPEELAEAALTAETSVENQVLIVRFSREMETDLAPLLRSINAEAALARMDQDRRTLRIALRVPARAHVSRSYNVLAVDLLPPDADDPEDVISPRAQAEAEARAAAEAAAAARSPEALPVLEVRRATNPAFDRIVFDWPERVDYALEERGAEWVLRFSRDAEPDIGHLRADLPVRLASIEAHHDDGALSIHIVPTPGSAPRAFRERNTVILDLTAADSSEGTLAQLEALAEAALAQAAEEPAAAAPEAEAEPGADAPTRLIDPPETAAAEAETAETNEAATEAETTEASAAPADPVPESGIVTARVTAQGPDLLIEFPWAAPVRAAAFRRAGAIWIVFDAQAALDLGELERGQSHVTDAEMLTGPGYSAVRIAAPPATEVSVRGFGASWTFTLSDQTGTAPAGIAIDRVAQDDGPDSLLAALPDAAEPVWILDPAVGDSLMVAAAGGPPRGALARRDYLSFSILPSAHGLAVETLSTALEARAAPEGVWIDPPVGGASPAATASGPATGGPSPAFIAFAGRESAAQYETRRAEMEKRAAEEDLPSAQVEMARFLLTYELAPEALGMLRLAAERDEQLAADPAFRGLRGVAYALAGRWPEAENDLSHPALLEDSTAQIWRGWVHTQTGDWTGARRAFQLGHDAIPQFTAEWRARFREAYARASLEQNDLTTAIQQIEMAGMEPVSQAMANRIALDAARWREAAGQPDDALAAYDGLAHSGDEEVEARAILAAARLAYAEDRIGAAELIERLEGLRWRWRGDDIELEAIRTLGAIYVEQGQTRQGLETMQTAVARFPDHPAARPVFTEMMRIFNELFLEGGADRLDPVEALALYFQFSDLTPIGSEGDRMIRRLSERLVAFDLLPQAAELLQHQVDERLHEPRARAQVAADLALIYLMDRRPEAALRTLRSTRVSQLPQDLAEERRIMEARALAELNANDAALDLIAGDPSVEAARLRADIAWSQRDWPLAGERLEELLGERWRTPEPVSAEESSIVLRAAIAWALASDSGNLQRLAGQYRDLMRDAPDNAAFTAVTQELETGGLRLAEIAERAADVTALETFLATRRPRLAPQQPAAAADQPPPAEPAPAEASTEEAAAPAAAAPAAG